MSIKRFTMDYKKMLQGIVDANNGNISLTAKQIGVTSACVNHWLGRLKQTEPNIDNMEKIKRAYNEK